MGRYVKIATIEAEVYQPGMEDGFVCKDVSGKLIGYYDKDKPMPRVRKTPAMKTLEGFHEVSEGDYVITGVEGERYPCKPDIFKKTYREVI